MLSLIGTLISGALVGWIAGLIMHQSGGTLRNIVVGIVGSALGSALFALVGFYAYGYFANLIVDIIGACVLLMLVNWLSNHY